VAGALGGSWRPFVPGFRFRDRGYSVRELLPPARGQRTLASQSFAPYAFDAQSG
jgi:hypothetical protein